MNKGQIFRMYIYESIIKLIEDENPSITSYSPAVKDSFDFFKTKVFKIVKAIRQENQIAYEVMSKKAENKKKLCKASAEVEMLLENNYSILSNSIRKQQIYDDLYIKKDSYLEVRIQAIHDNAIKNLASLVKYGITLSLINEFQNMIKSYFNSIDSDKIKAKKTSNVMLREHFKEAENALREKLDKELKGIKDTNPDFFCTYKLIRNLKNKSNILVKQ